MRFLSLTEVFINYIIVKRNQFSMQSVAQRRKRYSLVHMLVVATYFWDLPQTSVIRKQYDIAVNTLTWANEMNQKYHLTDSMQSLTLRLQWVARPENFRKARVCRIKFLIKFKPCKKDFAFLLEILKLCATKFTRLTNCHRGDFTWKIKLEVGVNSADEKAGALP